MPFSVQARDLSVFLRSCAYGTAAGALLGLGIVAVSENPGERMNTIARGASLGLYAGIGFGFYALNSEPQGRIDYSFKGPIEKIENPFWFSFHHQQGQISGLQLNWASLSF